MLNVGMMTAIIVGGAYSGDNLSFISDTTVVATQTQNCKMSDKFKVNSMIVVPAAVLVLIAYSVMGIGLQAPTHINEVEYMKVLPYLIVLITAIAGMNVMAVLTLGTLLCGAIGIGSHLLGRIRKLRPLWLVLSHGQRHYRHGRTHYHRHDGRWYARNHPRKRRNRFHHQQDYSPRETASVEPNFLIAALVSMVNICTANNTVAILTVGNISKKIGDRFGDRQPQGSQHSRHLLVHGSGTDSLWRADASGSRSVPISVRWTFFLISTIRWR